MTTTPAPTPDWHAHGMAWALGYACGTPGDDWTMDDVARAYAAGAAAAAVTERERCAMLCEDSNTFEYDDPGGFFARLIRGA